MADFPSNLDARELLLLSDTSSGGVPSKFHRPHYPSELAFMEDITHRFAALAYLKRRSNSSYQTLAKPPPNSERFTPPVRYGSICSLPDEYIGFNGGLGVGYAHGLVEALWTGSRPAYSCQFVNPVQHQVGRVMEARARVLSREQNRNLQNGVLPVQKGGLGVCGGGGLVRKSGGTGVFLPRIATTGTTAATTTARNITTTTTSDVRRRQISMRNRQEMQVIPHRNPVKTVDVGKQEECHYQLPPDMGLPQDWTY